MRQHVLHVTQASRMAPAVTHNSIREIPEGHQVSSKFSRAPDWEESNEPFKRHGLKIVSTMATFFFLSPNAGETTGHSQIQKFPAHRPLLHCSLSVLQASTLLWPRPYSLHATLACTHL